MRVFLKAFKKPRSRSCVMCKNRFVSSQIPVVITPKLLYVQIPEKDDSSIFQSFFFSFYI